MAKQKHLEEDVIARIPEEIRPPEGHQMVIDYGADGLLVARLRKKRSASSPGKRVEKKPEIVKVIEIEKHVPYPVYVPVSVYVPTPIAPALPNNQKRLPEGRPIRYAGKTIVEDTLLA
jgi:hypothetical protein